MKGRFHPLAWLAWLLPAAFLIVQVRNPLYLIVLLLGILVVRAFCAVSESPLPLALGRLATLVLLLATLFHMLTAHIGSTTLFSLPASWWLIGGPITLESAVAGFANGLALFTLLLLFVTFNMAVPVYELSRLTPPALRNVGMVMLIGLTYMPQTARHWQQIREAQAVRGHRLRSWRDWRPIFIPLLTGGLERSMSLAEAMVARGYGSTSDSQQPAAVRLALLLGLISVLGGWALAAWWPLPGWGLVLLGVLVVAVVYRQLGRLSPRTIYRPRPWLLRDTLVVVTAALTLLPILLNRFLGGTLLYYSPYPAITLPPFNPLIGLSLLLLVAPAIIDLATDNWLHVERFAKSLPYPRTSIYSHNHRHDLPTHPNRVTKDA